MDREPRPRERSVSYEAFRWVEASGVPLKSVQGSIVVDFVDLLDQRETLRDFGHPVPDETLGKFLWLACRNRSLRPSPFGVAQESRVHPSAGAMHPIHTLISAGSGAWHRYDPVHHELREVACSDNAASLARAKAHQVVPLNRGTLVALIAEPGKTAAKYERYESLIWRDAGVVLGYMSIVAQALGLSFCPLGLTGHPYALDGWSTDDELVSAGLAVLGVPKLRNEGKLSVF